MNHEAVLLIIKKIIERYMFDNIAPEFIYNYITERFFHNIQVNVLSVDFMGVDDVKVDVAIENDVYSIEASPHKFQQFHAVFTTRKITGG